jgi:hypothetical protein
MPRPYLYLILSLHIHLATTSDPMRWRGSSAEHVYWRRSAMRCGARSAVPRSDHAKSERTWPVLALATVGALQLRRSRRDGNTSRCAGSFCQRPSRYHLWVLS